MENSIKISVVTPSFNQGKYIEENILSVLNQDYENIEHIIFDACSTDNTIQVLKNYPHLSWVSEKDNGQSDALNKGFNQANGEWILWLNADDVLLPNAILKYIDAISNKKKKFDIIHGNMSFFMDGNPTIFKKQYFVKYNYLYSFFGIVTYPSTGTLFKSNLLKSNNLNTNFHYMMDAEWYLRCGHNLKILSLNDFFVKFRISEFNKTSEQIQYGYKNSQQIKEEKMIFDLYVAPFFFKNYKLIQDFFYRFMKLTLLTLIRIKKSFKYFHEISFKS